MSAADTDVDVWRQARDDVEELADAIANVPAFEDFDLTEESSAELRRAAALLQEALPLLRQAAERESPRYLAHEERREAAEAERGSRPRLRLVEDDRERP